MLCLNSRLIFESFAINTPKSNMFQKRFKYEWYDTKEINKDKNLSYPLEKCIMMQWKIIAGSVILCSIHLWVPFEIQQYSYMLTRAFSLASDPMDSKKTHELFDFETIGTVFFSPRLGATAIGKKKKIYRSLPSLLVGSVCRVVPHVPLIFKWA